MIATAELRNALRALSEAPEFGVSDLAERVAADRTAAGKPALPIDELHDACRVFLGRTFGFATAEEHEADLERRTAEAIAGGPEALKRFADELTAEANNHALHADLLHVELVRRKANGAGA